MSPLAPTAALAVGTSLGPYEVLAPIGSGGMGEVYRARDSRLGRIVALKVLSPATLDRPGARACFEREARIIASLNHPNICALYDVGHDAGVDFLVMQYLEGETLAARLLRGPLAMDDALRYAVQIAEAIDAAHRQGITHRDLKPANIMLTKAGALLLDFGIARARAPCQPARDDPDESTASATITRANAIVGTVRYMAPEVLDGAEADGRSDLFSFGAVVYEMITGRRAFDGDSTARVIAAVLDNQPAPIIVHRPDASQPLDAAVQTCLAKKPSDRWQNAGDLLRHLQWIAATRAPAPSPFPGARVRDRRRGPWALAAVAGVVLSFALPMLQRPRPRADPARPPPPHLVALRCIGPTGQAERLAFCNGLTETVIGKLVRLTGAHRLQVTPQLGGLRRDVSTPAAAHKILGATLVLQAAVGASDDRPSNPEFRQIEYRLVDARTGVALDTRRFSVDVSSPFSAHDSVTAWLVRNTEVDLTPAERDALATHGSQTAGAYAGYLAGRGYLSEPGDPSSPQRASKALERAVQLDPEFALAHAALGMARWVRFERSGDARQRDRALQACESAARLRPGLAEANVCLGTQHHAAGRHADAAAAFERAAAADPTNDDAHFGLGREQEDLRDFAAAEQTYRRAAAQRPDYFQTHVWIANFYRRQARYDDAAHAFERAVALVPSNARGHAFLAVPFIYIGRYDQAIEQLRASVEIEPSREAYVNWGMTLYRMRRFEEAAATIERGRGLGPPDHLLLACLARAYYWSGTPPHRRQALQLYLDAIGLAERELEGTTPKLRNTDLQVALADYYARVGRPDKARAHLAKAGLRPDTRPTDAQQLFFAALVYYQIGDRREALDWLERAVSWGVPAAELRAWIDLDGLRDDPGFQRLLRAN